MTIKDLIKAEAQKQKGRKTPVKAWGVDCFVRIMSGTERDGWESQIFQDGKMDKEKFRARLLSLTLADDQSNRIFQDSDINELSDFDSVELDRLYTISAKENALTKSDVDELTKN